MADIPQQLVDSILVKCGRRCCVCRRFRPTKLQVHHILERSKGGTDEEDNLMPICLPCHSDVHSHVPFARRFTVDELKAHRDALFRAVLEGRLPADEKEITTDLVRLVDANAIGGTSYGTLSPAAVELLLASVSASNGWQGMIVILDSDAGKQIVIREKQFGGDGPREKAKYLSAARELEQKGLARPEYESTLVVTYEGYLVADELLAEHGRKTD